MFEVIITLREKETGRDLETVVFGEYDELADAQEDFEALTADEDDESDEDDEDE